MLYSHYSEIKKKHWPYVYFLPAELACKGNGSLLVDHSAVSLLDALREKVGQPIFITSAYRSPLHNARVGGAPLSLHKFGRAFDISLNGHDRHLLADAAKSTGFTGFGYYNTFLHVDTGRARFWGKKW